jgi:hypothetical protein
MPIKKTPRKRAQEIHRRLKQIVSAEFSDFDVYNIYIDCDARDPKNFASIAIELELSYGEEVPALRITVCSDWWDSSDWPERDWVLRHELRHLKFTKNGCLCLKEHNVNFAYFWEDIKDITSSPRAIKKRAIQMLKTLKRATKTDSIKELCSILEE